MSGPYAYTSWNYGYTLCPETGAQFHQPPMGQRGGYAPRGRGAGGRGQPFARGGRGGYHTQQKPSAPQPAQAPEAIGVEKTVDEKEDGEIVERPIEEILKGRNPVMFCNDQSKIVSSSCSRK